MPAKLYKYILSMSSFRFKYNLIAARTITIYYLFVQAMLLSVFQYFIVRLVIGYISYKSV